MYSSNDAKGANPLMASGYLDFSDLDHINMNVRMKAEKFQIIDSKENSRSEVFGKAFVNFMGMMRGELDNLPELVAFGTKLEEACIETLKDGIMTKDLVNLVEGLTPTAVNTLDFIKAIRARLEKKLA